MLYGISRSNQYHLFYFVLYIGLNASYKVIYAAREVVKKQNITSQCLAFIFSLVEFYALTLVGII